MPPGLSSCAICDVQRFRRREHMDGDLADEALVVDDEDDEVGSFKFP